MTLRLIEMVLPEHSGKEVHVLMVQPALYNRAKCNWAARRGEYNAAIERT